MASGLNDFVDGHAKATFGKTRTEAHTDGVCINCKASVSVDFNLIRAWKPGDIYSPEGLKEYGISGLCEFCWDEIMLEDDNA